MGDFSSPELITPRLVNSMSRWSAMQSMVAAGVTFGNPSSAAWPTANRAIYMPFAIPFELNVKRVFWCNGASTTGNADMGVYSHTGARLFSIGTTARTGTSVLQYVTLGTPFLLSPGDYYMAFALDSGTGSMVRFSSSVLSDWKMTGLLQQASAFPLPASATFATMVTAMCPLMGLTSLGSGF